MGGQNCFPSPAPFSLFLSFSGGLLVEFWWCLKPPGFHMTTREPKRAHLRVPVFTKTKIQREDPQRERQRERTSVRKREKSAKFWAVRRRAVRKRGSGGSWGEHTTHNTQHTTHNTTQHNTTHTTHNTQHTTHNTQHTQHTLAKNGLAKNGLAKNGQIKMAKNGLAKNGLSRCDSRHLIIGCWQVRNLKDSSPQAISTVSRASKDTTAIGRKEIVCVRAWCVSCVCQGPRHQLLAICLPNPGVDRIPCRLSPIGHGCCWLAQWNQPTAHLTSSENASEGCTFVTRISRLPWSDQWKSLTELVEVERPPFRLGEAGGQPGLSRRGSQWVAGRCS